MIKLYKDTGIPVGSVLYDIETPPLPWWAYSSGKQYLSYGQLVIPGDVTQIMTICWMVVGENKLHTLNWIDHSQEEIIKIFTEVIDNAPLVIGKNNHNFDDKHVNTLRLLTGGNPNPDWISNSDDVQKHLKKHFNMQSYSLAHACEMLGLTSKYKMQFSDWTDFVKYKNSLVWQDAPIDVQELWAGTTYHQNYDDIVANGIRAFKKFLTYNRFDVKITWELVKKISPFVNWKYNINSKNRLVQAPNYCRKCGHNVMHKNGPEYRAGALVKYRFRCSKCKASVIV